VLSARIPLSGFSAADNKQDSPFLFAVFRLEGILGVGSGALAVALAAAALSGAAVLVAHRRRGGVVALGLAVVAAGAASVGAFAFDAANARNVRASHLPPDLRWIDHAARGLGPVTLLQTPGAPRGRALEQLFWNSSVTRIALLKGAIPTDAFGARTVGIERDGRLSGLRGSLLVENFGARVELAGARRVARGTSLELWRSRGTPRMAVLASGLYFDGWLARTGSVTVWPAAGGVARGTLSLTLSLPPGTERTPLHFRAPGVDRGVWVSPGGRRVVRFQVHARGPWRLVFRTTQTGFLGDGRAISVKAAAPRFVRG
jgi:hypothetical protein